MPIDIDWTNPDPEHLDSLEPHPYADLVPEMSPDEFVSLKEDIRENGLLEPIVIYDRQVLDGRHRHRAVSEVRHELETGWSEDHFVEFEGSDEDAFRKVTENVQRRHLGKAGLASVACTLYLDAAKEKARERKEAGVTAGDVTGEAYSIAAQRVSGVSGRSVRDVDAIRQDPDLEDVWQDLLAGRFRFISEAQNLAKLDVEDREAARARWLEQSPREKDWKKALKAAGVGDEPDAEDDMQRVLKRLRGSLKSVSTVFDEMHGLPTLRGLTGQKRSEYRNFIKALLEDVEAVL
jgi:hypothetical protein